MDTTQPTAVSVVTLPPAVLYKYVRPERIDVLRFKRIRFTQPIGTNDPFELRPIFDSMIPEDDFESIVRPTDEMLEEALRKNYQALPAETQDRLSFDDMIAIFRANPDLIENAYREIMPSMKRIVRDLTPRIRAMMTNGFRRMVGILSLTETPNNQAMWAHYSDNHRGFVLGFDTANEYFHRQRSDKDEFNHLRRVRYLDRPCRDVSLIELNGNDVFFTKGSDWAYEREWRMITPLQSDLSKAPADDEVVLFDYPASALCEVIVGARASATLRLQLTECLKSDVSLAHVKVCEAYVPASDSSIAIRTRQRDIEDV